MVIYEVNLIIENEIFAEYMAWLKPHIKEMLKFPGFMNACIYQVSPDPDSKNIQICIHYTIKTKENLDYYFNHHAESMRSEPVARFGNHFKATRRVLVLYEKCV